MSNRTPFGLVSAVERTVVIERPALLAACRQMERSALADPPAFVGAALQDARFVTGRTLTVYRAFAAAGSVVRLHARGLQAWLAPGLVGVELDDDDPLVDEWVVVLPAAHRPAVLAAADLEADREGPSRSYRYAISADPEVVAGCAQLLGGAPSMTGAG